MCPSVPSCRTVVLCPEGDASLFRGEDSRVDDGDHANGQHTSAVNILRTRTTVLGGIRVPRFVQALSNLALCEPNTEREVGAADDPIGGTAVRTGRRDIDLASDVSRFQNHQQQEQQQVQQQQVKLSTIMPRPGGLSLHNDGGGEAHPHPRMVPELLVGGSVLQPGLDAVLLPAIQLPRNARSRATAGFVPLLLEINGVLQPNFGIEEALGGSLEDRKGRMAVPCTAPGGGSGTDVVLTVRPVVGRSDNGGRGHGDGGNGRGRTRSRRGRGRSNGGESYGISTGQYVYVQPARQQGGNGAVRKVNVNSAVASVSCSPSGGADGGQPTDPRASLAPADDDCRQPHWHAAVLTAMMSVSPPAAAAVTMANASVTRADAKTGTSAQLNNGQILHRELRDNSIVRPPEDGMTPGVALDGPPTDPRVSACVCSRPSTWKPSGARPPGCHGISQPPTEDSPSCTAQTVSAALMAQTSGTPTLSAVLSVDAFSNPRPPPSPATLLPTPSHGPRSTRQGPAAGGRQLGGGGGGGGGGEGEGEGLVVVRGLASVCCHLSGCVVLGWTVGNHDTLILRVATEKAWAATLERTCSVAAAARDDEAESTSHSNQRAVGNPRCLSDASVNAEFWSCAQNAHECRTQASHRPHHHRPVDRRAAADRPWVSGGGGGGGWPQIRRRRESCIVSKARDDGDDNGYSEYGKEAENDTGSVFCRRTFTPL
ncbi:hypothetical protein Vafri_18948 [Volvox africanus]|uniref:Uncharacterized protein n=1 Tax=Volvox africanus TaxID=51714 RepID=A0A8J4BN97_9CHLO|nr:hypothetical protein Vafri_18948 [Volvox africanus]